MNPQTPKARLEAAKMDQTRRMSDYTRALKSLQDVTNQLLLATYEAGKAKGRLETVEDDGH